MRPQAAPRDPPVDRALASALGLSAAETRAIWTRLGRTPTYTELGMFSVMWSEHCSYKHSRRLLRRFPTRGPTVLQGPGENAGGVLVAPRTAVLLKIESHNHPSMVEPYQGAATGVGGILRDIFTMGARPVALLDSLRFGPPRDARTRRVVRGVVEGIGGYGNCIGIPTVGGELGFDPCYAGNCLVNALAIGVVDPAVLTRAKAAGPGNLVVYMGAPTGRDGIHGASLLASQGFKGRARPASHGGGISAVQVADPFLGKLLMEASIELCERKLLVGMQDMGAAGLSCSTCEMSAKGRTGMDVDLDRVPLRTAGMTPYEIMLSESQERMLLVVAPRRLAAVRAVVAKYGIPLAVIGRVRAGGRVRLRRHGRLIADVPARALTDEVPLHPLPRRARPPAPAPVRPAGRAPRDPGRALLALLADPSLGSKRPVWRQYDHMVRTNAVVLPGSDAAVLRLKGTDRHVACSVDGPARACAADPFAGGELAIAESARNVACAGGRPVAFTNGLNFPNPDRPGNLWAFGEVVRGIARGARKLGTPVVSGNVSFYNEFKGVGIAPTPMVGVLGVLEGWAPVAAFLRRDGDLLVWLGGTASSLGASAYGLRFGRGAGRPARVRWPLELGLQRTLVAAASRGLLGAAHDCGDGGALVALAELCAAGADADVAPLGAEADLAAAGIRGTDPAALFGEGPSRVLVACAPERFPELRRLARGVPCRVIGRAGGDRLVVRSGARRVLDLPVSALAAARSRALAGLFA